MNGDLKTREMTTRATLPKKLPSQASEKENADVGGAPQEKQRKAVRFNLCPMDFRRRIKSDCNVIAESQRAPLGDLQLNLPGKNAGRDEQVRRININMPSYNVAKAPSGYKDDLSSPVVTVEPITQGVMSPIKPNIFTTEQTLLAQCPSKPAARKETLAHKARDNRKIYEPAVFYKNFYVSDYSEDVIAYLLQNERRHMVQKNYLQIYDVNPANRACIVDWLMQIQVRYKISINTFLLGIRLFDALLASVHIPKNMYQLISLTLLWIIHKFDSNTRIIHVKNLVSDCYNAYNPGQFLHMEQKVLKFFNFDYNLPEPMSYLFYYSEKIDIKSEILIRGACYILESYTLTEEYSTEPPSLLAAAALCLSLRITFTFNNIEVEYAWNKLRNHLGYHDIQTIRPVQNSMQVQIKKINTANYEYQEVCKKHKVMKWFHIFQTNLQVL